MLPEGESQEGVGYDVWEDPWIPTISNFKPKPFNPASQCQINRVSDLICTSPCGKPKSSFTVSNK